MDNFLATIAQGWARLIEAIGLADLAHSWFVVFFTLVIAAFAVAGAFGAIALGVAGARERHIPIERPGDRAKAE